MEQSKSQDSLEEKNITTIFPFSAGQIGAIFSAELDMNLVFMLEVIDKDIDIGLSFTSYKAKSWIQTLMRKQYLTESGRVSTKGKSLLSLLSGGSAERYVQAEDPFKIWWNTYPRTANFTYKGVTFKSMQVKRVNEDKCRVQWEECLAEGFTPSEIISGTKNHFELAMEQSVKEKENKVQFINNSETYLRRRAFADYIDAKTGGEGIDSIDI